MRAQGVQSGRFRHFVARDIQADRFAGCTRISDQVVERVLNRGRRGREVKKNAGVPQIHFGSDMQPEERVVRLDSGELEESALSRKGYAARFPEKPGARKLSPGQQRLPVKPVPVQVMQ